MDQAKFNERRRIFDDAIHLRKPERVPTLSNVFTWKIFDTDITPRPTIEEATNDWTLMEKITREHIERYQFDGYYDLGDRNNSGYQKIFGYKLMHIIKGDTVNALDPKPLEIEELIPYAKDVDMYTWKHLMPMRFGEITYGQLSDALESMLAYGEFVQKMRTMCVEEYSVPIGYDFENYVMMPTEFALSLRGIKNIGVDMRRHPEIIEDYIAFSTPAILEQVDRFCALPDNGRIWCGMIGCLASTVMSLKQFERFDLPLYNEVIRRVAASGKCIWHYHEGNLVRLAQFFQDVPVGAVTFMIEQDDIYDVFRALPNASLSGGLYTNLLRNGTVEENVDACKRLLDTHGGRGLILSQNKMMSFENDATRQNMMAVQEFALNYRP